MNTLRSTPLAGATETDAVIEEGVYQDPAIDRRHPDLRAEYAVFERFETVAQRRLRVAREEAEYASKCGPVVVKRAARDSCRDCLGLLTTRFGEPCRTCQGAAR